MTYQSSVFHVPVIERVTSDEVITQTEKTFSKTRKDVKIVFVIPVAGSL
jgi:hypothetical protein